jgi:hypothetical protein
MKEEFYLLGYKAVQAIENQPTFRNIGTSVHFQQTARRYVPEAELFINTVL